MSALQIETDSLNTHMLLGGLMLCVQDSVNFEEVENSPSEVQSARDTNLLSSGKNGSESSFSVFFIISEKLIIFISTRLFSINFHYVTAFSHQTQIKQI